MKKSSNRRNAVLMIVVMFLMTAPLVSCKKAQYQEAILITETTVPETTTEKKSEMTKSTGTTAPYTTVPAEETTTAPETTAEQKETSAVTAKPKTTVKKTQPKTTAKPKTTKPVTTIRKPVTTTKPKPTTTTTKRQEQGQFLSSAADAVSNINAKRTANKLVTLKKSGSLQASAESKAKAKSGVLYSCNGKMSAAAAAGKIVAAYPGIISSTKYKNYGCAVWYDGTKSYLVFLVN